MAQLRDLPGFGTFVDALSWAISNFNSPDRAYFIAIGILAAAMVCWI